MNNSIIVEERIWSLIERFISGEATSADMGELICLLKAHHCLLSDVKEFFEQYVDSDPCITAEQKLDLISRAEGNYDCHPLE